MSSKAQYKEYAKRLKKENLALKTKPVPIPPPILRHIENVPKSDYRKVWVNGMSTGVLIGVWIAVIVIIITLLTSCATTSEIYSDIYPSGGVFEQNDSIIGTDTLYYWKAVK